MFFLLLCTYCNPSGNFCTFSKNNNCCCSWGTTTRRGRSSLPCKLRKCSAFNYMIAHGYSCTARPACSASEFRCDDGTCIPDAQRCNFRAECPDQSDERGCGTCSTITVAAFYAASKFLHIFYTKRAMNVGGGGGSGKNGCFSEPSRFVTATFMFLKVCLLSVKRL